ncbi:MAG: AMP-binding protein, partial [Acidimicrobiia bacterium]
MLLVGEILTNAARVTPDGVAATLGDAALTFAELEAASNEVANGLAGAGAGYGDRVLWWGDTSLDALPVFGALAKLGVVFAPLNARASVEEVRPVAEYARPRLLLAGASHRDAAAELAAATAIPHLDPVPAGSSRPPAPAPLGETDPHVIFFTSGSTGRPKGVVLSHRANWLRTYPGATSTTGGGGTVCMFPLFHMAGWTIALGAWQARRPVHFVAVPDADTLCGTVARHRAARLYCIPAVWARVLEHARVREDLASLVEADTGTSATPPELLLAIKEALPWTVTRVFYGSTEAGPGTQLGDVDLSRKPGSVGLPQAGVDVRLDDRGEVCMRSAFLMDGYFDAPDATAETLRDGWYHT